MGSPVTIDDAGGIAVVRIDRPPANALDPQLLAAGIDAAAELRASSPAAVVVTGAGRFFSGGIDLKLAPALSEDEQRELVAAINRLFFDWYSLTVPVVAAVNGHAVAGGMILALCGDHRVGVAEASYGLTEVRVGAPYPAAALAVVRSELGPPAARRLVLAGELLDGEAALALGLLDELAATDALEVRALEVARRLAEAPADTYATVKSQLREPAIAAMRAAVDRDPLGGAWLSAEAESAAAAALRGD